MTTGHMMTTHILFSQITELNILLQERSVFVCLRALMEGVGGKVQ